MSKKITLEGLDHFKDKENAMIAGKPESTNTATVAHVVGEYFYWKGVLHIVTAAIAVGGTIQTNTNVKPAVLADDVSDLKESTNDLKTAVTQLEDNATQMDRDMLSVLPYDYLHSRQVNQYVMTYIPFTFENGASYTVTNLGTAAFSLFISTVKSESVATRQKITDSVGVGLSVTFTANIDAIYIDILPLATSTPHFSIQKSDSLTISTNKNADNIVRLRQQTMALSPYEYTHPRNVGGGRSAFIEVPIESGARYILTNLGTAAAYFRLTNVPVAGDSSEVLVGEGIAKYTTVTFTAATDYKYISVSPNSSSAPHFCITKVGIKLPSMRYYGLPFLAITGDLTGMSKDTEIENLQYIYYVNADTPRRLGVCSMKWQGSSSLVYEKKNYTIKFDNAFEAKTGWGSHTKYCLKANYIDASQARNVVSARIWGQIVKSRTSSSEDPTDSLNRLKALPDGGAIDGFPVALFINNEFKGLYTFNIPKDKWMFGMGSASTEYIVGAETHSNATYWNAEAVGDGTDFEIEYAPENVQDSTIITALNTAISTAMASGDNVSTLANYVDIDSVIDYIIFIVLIGGIDCIDKNYLLANFDGVKWFFSAYDLDSVFGNMVDGKGYYTTSTIPTFTGLTTSSLFGKIITYKKTELKARYTALRASALSEDNVLTIFSNFMAAIPRSAKMEEVEAYPTAPGTETNNLAQITEWYRMRVRLMDAQIESL